MVRDYKDTTVRQKQIVSAARRLIVKYGSEHVTVRRMANEIGVTEAAIYRHFKSKKDVLSFLVDDIEDTLVSDIEKKLTGSNNTLEVLEDALRAQISLIERRKGVSFQVIAEIISLGDKKLNAKIYDCINNYLEKIRGVLSLGVKEGSIRDDIDVDATAILFFGMVQGLATIWTLSHYSSDIEKDYSAVWNVFRRAIIKR